MQNITSTSQTNLSALEKISHNTATEQKPSQDYTGMQGSENSPTAAVSDQQICDWKVTKLVDSEEQAESETAASVSHCLNSSRVECEDNNAMSDLSEQDVAEGDSTDSIRESLSVPGLESVNTSEGLSSPLNTFATGISSDLPAMERVTYQRKDETVDDMTMADPCPVDLSIFSNRRSFMEFIMGGDESAERKNQMVRLSKNKLRLMRELTSRIVDGKMSFKMMSQYSSSNLCTRIQDNSLGGEYIEPEAMALIEIGEQLDVQDFQGRTALHIATKECVFRSSIKDSSAAKYKRIVFHLLQKGANPALRDRDQKKPIHYAIERKWPMCRELINAFVAAGTDLNETIDGRPLADILVENNIYPGHDALIKVHRTCKLISVMKSVRFPEIDTLKRMCRHVICKSTSRIDELTCLPSALIEYCSNALPFNDLFYAIVTRQDVDYADVFRRQGPDFDINQRDDEGNTALHLAIRDLNHHACKVLLELGADVSTVNKYDRTPEYYRGLR